MTAEAVLDASALIAAVADESADGVWARDQLMRPQRLCAPALVLFETANGIRKHELAGRIDAAWAAQATADALALSIELWSFDALAARAWKHRSNLTIYDASYVALAEQIDAPLITLDRRISRAPGVECEVLTPA